MTSVSVPVYKKKNHKVAFLILLRLICFKM